MNETDRPPRSLWKGVFDELRVQAHLGAMDLRDRVGPWLHEVEAAARERVRQRGKPPQEKR